MSSVTINPDKTLTVNGRKLFAIAMWSICNEQDYPSISGERCITSVTKIKNNFWIQLGNLSTGTQGEAQKTLFDNNGLFFVSFPNVLELRYDLSNHTNAFGSQLKQEPDDLFYHCTNGDFPCEHTWVKSQYNLLKTESPTRPVVLPIMGKVNTTSPSSLKYWSDTTDILVDDSWSYRPRDSPDRSVAGTSKEYWIRNALYHDTNGDTNTIPAIIWAGIQGAGIASPEIAWWADYYILNEKEQREQVYIAITRDVKGIAVWGYKSWISNTIAKGLVANPEAFEAINIVAAELKLLNDILVLPTETYRWLGYKKDNVVSFSNTYPFTFNSWGTTHTELINFNWILKNNPTNNNKYLLILNKGNLSITTTINISTISGNQYVTTIGNQTTGSGRINRNIQMTNGSFTDTFDPHTVHIYQISNCQSPQCNFAITTA